MPALTGPSSIDRFVSQHLKARDVRGLHAVDVPAGRGKMSALMAQLGAEVTPLDLNPDFFEQDLTCKQADLTQTLPLEDDSADLVLCQEGIEHLPDQAHAISELARILKPGGRLLLTTPNISNLRARLTALVTESDQIHRLPPDSTEAIWKLDEAGNRYYGHLFLIGVQRLRTLAQLHGLKLLATHRVRASTTALLALPFAWPVLFAATQWAKHATKRRMRSWNDGKLPDEVATELDEIARLNLDPTILLGKHLFVEFEKAGPAATAASPKPRELIV